MRDRGKVVPIKEITPSDLLASVIKFRQVLTATDAAAFATYADYEGLRHGLGADAAKARKFLEAAAQATQTLLLGIDETEMYKALRAGEDDEREGQD